MALCIYAFWQFGFLQCDKCINAFQHHVKCQLPIFHNANLPLPEMLHCISESVGLQINILSMCTKLVGRIAYYHRGLIALKHGSDWNIPMSEFHLATAELYWTVVGLGLLRMV